MKKSRAVPVHSSCSHTASRKATQLIEELRIIIDSFGISRDAEDTEHEIMLFWEIGKRLRNTLSRISTIMHQHALLDSLSHTLVKEHGPSYVRKELLFMMDFNEHFSDVKEAAELARQLTWRHCTLLAVIPNPLRRAFYKELCLSEGWSAQELKRQIDDLLFEHTQMDIKGNRPANRVLNNLLNKDKFLEEFVYREPQL